MNHTEFIKPQNQNDPKNFYRKWECNLVFVLKFFFAYCHYIKKGWKQGNTSNPNFIILLITVMIFVSWTIAQRLTRRQPGLQFLQPILREWKDQL